MDEKTEQLRDIFMEVAEDGTVTESQTQRRGSLLGDRAVDERLAEVIDRMRDRFGLETDLSTDTLCTLVREFFHGTDDEGIAARLEVSPEAVFEARMDLHLVREDETDLDVAAVREQLSAGVDPDAIAERLDATPRAVRRADRIGEARSRARTTGQRFRTEFREVLTDADIAVRLTADAHEDGLAEATEDMEVDVDF